MSKSINIACQYLHRNINKGKIIVGGKVRISKNSIIDITGDVILGNNVVISDWAKLYTHYHNHSGKQIIHNGNDIKIVNKKLCDGVFLYECIITAKCSFIAKGVVIGAGSVVTKSIYEEFTIWAGNPARKIKKR